MLCKAISCQFYVVCYVLLILNWNSETCNVFCSFQQLVIYDKSKFLCVYALNSYEINLGTVLVYENKNLSYKLAQHSVTVIKNLL